MQTQIAIIAMCRLLLGILFHEFCRSIKYSITLPLHGTVWNNNNNNNNKRVTCYYKKEHIKAMNPGVTY